MTVNSVFREGHATKFLDRIQTFDIVVLKYVPYSLGNRGFPTLWL